MDTEVLVVGAGPTGLVLALWLARSGVRVRIIDRDPEASTSSRALAVQSRTLEFYRQLGFADEVVRAGLELDAVNLWARGKRAARVEFKGVDAFRSPFPYALIYPQDEHERLLIEKLAAAGVEVERDTELVDFEDEGDHVIARVGNAECTTAFIAGCDGARSKVREKLGIHFSGGTYEHLFYVADVEAGGPLMDQELHVSIDESDFVAIFPLKDPHRVRLIGTVRFAAPNASASTGLDRPPGERHIEWSDVEKSVLTRLEIDVRQVNWFSTYHVHHRVAASFHEGRALLVGDAAHIHSPVGGQGMNTGIGDAVNLAWKLAAVLRGRARMSLIDTYEPERMAFARRLVATTDRAFQLVTRASRLATDVRVHVAPRVISAAFALPALRRFLLRTLSQTAIQYRDSTLSDGHAGRIHGGDRLPWVDVQSDNFGPLMSLSWQVHVYGRAPDALAATCAARGLRLYVFPWSDGARAAGLERDAAYLVRPDGYVALADSAHSTALLERYLDARGLRFVPRSPRSGERAQAQL